MASRMQMSTMSTTKLRVDRICQARQMGEGRDAQQEASLFKHCCSQLYKLQTTATQTCLKQPCHQAHPPW